MQTYQTNKKSKNVLTRGSNCDKINKLSERAAPRTARKVEPESFGKSKEGKGNQAVRGKISKSQSKNFSEKTSKKGLTNEKKCDILSKSPHERDDKKITKTFEKNF